MWVNFDRIKPDPTRSAKYGSLWVINFKKFRYTQFKSPGSRRNRIQGRVVKISLIGSISDSFLKKTRFGFLQEKNPDHGLLMSWFLMLRTNNYPINFRVILETSSKDVNKCLAKVKSASRRRCATLDKKSHKVSPTVPD